MRKRTIALTGASGVVGRALLPELEDHEVVCLVHRGSVPEGDADVIRCDVAEPQLGLGRDEYRSLARRIDCVIHCAAVTDWASPAERFRSVNVGGARSAIGLAQDAEAPLYHVSTSFIRAIADDAPLRLPPSHIIVGYVTSKCDSEELVRESGVPHTIFRPTNLIGDSRTGEIARNQIVQLVAEFVCRGKVPLFPTRPGTLVDVIPQDVCAKAVAAVVEAGDVGREYWLTYGEDAMPVSEAIDLCVELMERLGRPIEPPRVIDPASVDEARLELETLSPMSRAFFDRLLEFSDGMTACGVFPSSLAMLRERYGLPDPSPRDAYVRGLEYWAASKGMREPVGA